MMFRPFVFARLKLCGYDPEIEEAAFAALQKKIAQSGSAVAVAFIGYVDSESSEADLRAYVAGSETGKEYPSLSRAPLYMAEGQELYAIIPPNDKGTIIVYPSMICLLYTSPSPRD